MYSRKQLRNRDRTDRTTNCQQLDLTITQPSMKVIFVVADHALPKVLRLGVDLHLPILLLIAETIEDTHG